MMEGMRHDQVLLILKAPNVVQGARMLPEYQSKLYTEVNWAG